MKDPLFPTYWWLQRKWEVRGSDVIGRDPEDGDCLAIAQVTGKASLNSTYTSPPRGTRDEIAHYIAGAPERIAALEARVTELEANAGKLPKEPSQGLLISMALRYDHGLLAPGNTFRPAVTPAAMDATLRQMRQLYEEASGHGFWSPENDCEYVARLDEFRRLSQPGSEKHE